jgi:putative membrane protein
MTTSERPPPSELVELDPQTITRPSSSLLGYYLFTALLTGPFLPITFCPLYFKYQTLRYRFDDQGISMQWGLLFRREIYLTYRRIQDIHLTTNLLQRWFGLATVAIQTASGSARPEMSIEGIRQSTALRDYLYTQMRGARGLDAPSPGEEPNERSQPADDVLSLLHEIRDLLQRQAADRQSGNSTEC